MDILCCCYLPSYSDMHLYGMRVCLLALFVTALTSHEGEQAWPMAGPCSFPKRELCLIQKVAELLGAPEVNLDSAARATVPDRLR